jgi:hypothetical protein
MNPIRFHGANVDFGKPLGWDEQKRGECMTLPVHVENGRCTSVWEPTVAQRERIAKGENVVLTITGRQPPVRLDVARIDGETLRFTGLERLIELACRVAEDPTAANDAATLAQATLKEFTNGK